MSNIISPDISIVPKYRNGIIGIFITIELILLTLVTFELYKISIIVVSGVIGVFVLYLFFNKPFLVIPTLLLSILAGTIGSSTSDSQASFTDLIFPILIAIFLIRTFYNKSEKSEQYNFIKTFYIAFLVWSLFTVLLAVDRSLALAYWRNYFAGFIVFLTGLAFIKNYKHIRFLIIVLIIWGIILAFIELNAFISLGSASSALVKVLLNKNLISTTWGRSNYFAAFYVLIIPISLGYLFSLKSKKGKSLLIIALILLFSGITITLSRGGLLSLGVAVLIFISKVLKPKTFFPLLGLILLISIILLLNPLTLFIFKGLSTVDSNLSTYSRLNFYVDVWNTFLKNPITGVGFANLGHYAQFKITNAPASAHNIILGALGETGII
ncbi:MAG: O-antigen ligase family protein, partial [Romboutsia sp.]|nr:O-antigen ligase family protein [Romboutsia sp.]